MLTLGPIPQDLQGTLRSWIADARVTDPDQLWENNSLFIVGGPAWSNSVSVDGTILVHDYSTNPPSVVTDEIARIKTVVIAGKRRPEFLCWLPCRPVSADDCEQCAATGWRELGDHEFVCDNCSGLGWLSCTENA